MSYTFTDYYAVLDVHRDAPMEEIKKSFRTLAKKYHPDLNPGDDTAETAFKLINEAYAVLGDAEMRRDFNQTHRRAGLGGYTHRGGGGHRGGWVHPHHHSTSSSSHTAYQYRSAAAGASSEAGGGSFRGKPGSSSSSSSFRWPGSGGTTRGSAAGNDFRDHVDYEAWNRAHYGPDEQSEQWNADTNKRFREAQARGFSNVNDPRAGSHANFESRRNARAAAAAWAQQQQAAQQTMNHMADKGRSETGHYRAWATAYRAQHAASEKAWPMTVVLWGIVLVGGYSLIHKVTHE